MKRFSSLALIFCIFSISPGWASNDTFSDLEAELLSLEQELMDKTELQNIEPLTQEPLIVVDVPQAPLSTNKISHPHEEKTSTNSNYTSTIDLSQVFSSSPFIYSLLLGMSCISITLCLYVILRIREQNIKCSRFSEKVREKFLSHNSSEIQKLCSKENNWLSKIVLSGLNGKKHGIQATLESMRSEGKRATLSAWQQLGILQDIAIMAPMLGLLGTVIGLFYAFYDLNRSLNSLSHLLDGLGISVGTTVAGIGVAIISMILHSIAKFRLLRSLAKIEMQASSLAYLIEDNDPS